MRLKALDARAAPGPDRAPREPNFYALPFASQMIVWATRKRLGAVCGHGAGRDDDVLQVFHMADWGELYAALLTVIDLMVAETAHHLLVHAVSCPCLARHEAYLLNALAHLQNRRTDEAALCLCEIVPPAAVRLALPHLQTVVTTLSAQGLRLVFVNLSAPVPSRGPDQTSKGDRRVH